MGKPQEKPDRFTLPKASLVQPAVGAVTYGLPDKAGLRIRQHEYEAEVADRNMAAADAGTAPPNGRRFAAGQDYMGRLEEFKHSYDDWKRPNKPAFKETLTSMDNPLRTPANDASGLPFYVDRNIPAAQVEEEQALKGKRCFGRNVNYGMMEQLAAGTLQPLSGTEMRESRQKARCAAAAAAHATCRVVRGPDDKGPSATAQVAEGQGLSSQSETEDVEAEEQGADCDPSAFPTADEQGGGKRVVMNQAAQELAAMRELEERLIREWPHGAPKHVLLKLSKEYSLPVGAGVPTLGFGFPSSLSSRTAAASLRHS